MLRLLLRQVCANEPQFPPAVEALYDRSKESGHSPSKKELEAALIETVRNLGKRVYILLDALDEIPAEEKRRAEVLQIITNMVQLAQAEVTNLHVLATSRDEVDIRRRLGSFSHGGTPIRTSKVDLDIAKYVRASLRDWPFEMTEDMRTLIEERLSTKAQGM